MFLSESKNRVTRREFLTGVRPKKEMKVTVDPERCTGCSRCLVECPVDALGLSRAGNGDGFQILFRPDLCDACSRCERSCPEHCLRLEERPEEEREKGVEVVFEGGFCRCAGCGAPLFPQAMKKSVETKLFGTGKSTWPIDLCPACRLQFSF